MSIDGDNIEEIVRNAKVALNEDKSLSPSSIATIESLLLVVSLLLNRLGLNSRNSSKPPSSDPDRPKKPRNKTGRKPGGQRGHKGVTLEKIDDPDYTQFIPIDKRTLPKGQYRDGGYESRQVFDIEIKCVVTEYQAQVLINENNECFVAAFPAGVNAAVQYGHQLKAHAVYLSQYQLLPFKRIEEYLRDQLGIPISAGSIANFNQKASELIVTLGIDNAIRQNLSESPLIHADETGINIGGKKHWLHCHSNAEWTYFLAHATRGREAIGEVNIIPGFTGILCHDHWKPYYHYTDCSHSLCNAHHLRELEYAHDKDQQQWAKAMQDLLLKINKSVKESDGFLSKGKQTSYRKAYRKILTDAEIECPPPDESKRKQGQRGKLKRSKSRNLLERLKDFQDDVLRFMTKDIVPFTNNQSENDIRMTKVQQKVSGCFRSMAGAEAFCRIRGYLSSCRKQNLSATQALVSLFEENLPGIFVKSAE